MEISCAFAPSPDAVEHALRNEQTTRGSNGRVRHGMKCPICGRAEAKHEPPFALSESQTEAGVRFCIRNARRLLTAARKLLRGIDSEEGLAYCLWSLAVEELGKALLLEQCLRGSVGVRCVVPGCIFREHHKRFELGLKELEKQKKLAHYDRVIRVHENRSAAYVTARDLNGVVAIAPGATGTFQDAVSGSMFPLTVETRMDMLYVGWDDESDRWLVPEYVATPPELDARVTFLKEQLAQNIELFFYYLALRSAKTAS